MTRLPLSRFLTAYKELHGDGKYETAAVGRYGIRKRSEIYSKELAKDYSKNHLIRKDTLTIGMGSRQIDIGILSTDDVYSVSPAYRTFKIRGINSDYLRYCLDYCNDDMSKRFMIASCRQGKAVDVKALLDYQIPIRGNPEQLQVVCELDRLCTLKKNAEDRLACLDQLVKSRFVEMFGDLVVNDRNHPVKKIQDVCHSIVDCPHTTPHYQTEDTGYGCIRTSIIRQGGILWDKLEYVSEKEYKERIVRREPQKGDVVYLREGGILGVAAIIDRDQRVALGQRSMLLSPSPECVVSSFLCGAMNSNSFYQRITSGIGCSTSPHINVADVKSFEIGIPPLALQKKFAAFVASVDKSKAALRETAATLDQLYRAKLQEYFG